MRCCTVCGKRPLKERRVLVHMGLKRVGTDERVAQWVRAVALCKVHQAWNNDALADRCWPGWRETMTQ